MTKLKIVESDERELALFEPAKARKTQAEGHAIIAYAKEIRDWPTLLKAINTLIKHQRIIVKWWEVNVRPHGGDRKSDQVRRPADLIPFREAERLLKFKNQTISRWIQRLADEEAYIKRLFGPSYNEALDLGPPPRGTDYSGEFEWYTPSRYIELARQVMGGIDLDPASSKAAQKTVRAEKFFTMEDDGLTQDWHGRVWMNPPYKQPAVAQFINRLVAQVAAGNVTQAVLLVNNSTDTEWFHAAVRACGAVCFTNGRIQFEHRDHTVKPSPTQGQAFLYFGGNVAGFAHVFDPVGCVLVPSARE